MTRSRLLAVSLAVAAAAAPAACGTEAKDPTPARAPNSAPPSRPSEQDVTWMRTAHRANLAEIDAGRIAQRKGTTPEIRSLGTMLVQDHTALDRKLTATADRLGVELPNAPSNRQRHELDQLKKREDRLFNLNWLTAMVHAHEKAVSATRTEIANGGTPGVVTLAKNALPVLEKHLARMRVAKGG